MISLFQWTGRIAIVLLIIACVTGLFGSVLRRYLKGTLVFKIHKWVALSALLFGLIHGLIYWLFLQ
ncbi:MAG: hypothetical protein WCQ97_07615 [Aminobacterium sp.]|jgi:predicted ferric reductase|uniref:hypothetical protein n=1 Tax=Aminobacterium sp. MB27-C1 TaxID=3070661 RepID=UPI001BCBC84B|nr:hypothetical protein [Aminobacterium sp. MB27-C1]MDD2206782.1 hypothetical protein [Aminobacterium sp.]MDD3426229.1 hypothetical protein [Aminobacterium sp.]MDD3708391.1 hypothetical protein [Aminobacterium sp.]MDD4229108.1 hypothetical protein [Aminobacterium sp.]MDD4552309.1 hypothetical protein [Aminobacterium sp.]